MKIKILNESESMAIPDAVNGMGNTILPGPDKRGSGDKLNPLIKK